MGYSNHFSGRIDIVPPLSFQELEQMDPALFAVRDILLATAEDRVTTSEGILLRRQGVALVPHEEGYSGYRVEEEIAQFVRAYPGHEFTGRIDAVGESGDHWRIKVMPDRRVVTFYAELTWPLESE